VHKRTMKLACVAAAMVFVANTQTQQSQLSRSLAPLVFTTDNGGLDQRHVGQRGSTQIAGESRAADLAHRYVAASLAAKIAMPGSDAVIPLVVDGNGVRTRIDFTNVDAITAKLTLTFGDGLGGGGQFQVAGLGLANTVNATIPPKGSYEIVTSGVGAGNVGWALFLATGGRVVAQTSIEQQDSTGVWQSSTTATANFFANRVSLPFDDTSGWDTQVVVVNCNPYTTAAVSMTVRDSGGNVVYSGQYNMATLNMGVVNDLRGLLGSTTFGTIEFAVADASQGGIAVLAVRSNDSGAFETVAPQTIADWLN
jgi:hypothetical protein